jgi:hypothetical protein
MTNVSFGSNSVRRAIAAQAGCDLAAFSREELTVVRRPEPPLWPFTAMVATFGTGTVVSVVDAFFDWARALNPPKHYHALSLSGALANEARSRGVLLEPWPPALGWALAQPPSVGVVPRGYELRRTEKDWMSEWQLRGGFENACGQPAQAHRTWRNLFAFALFDSDGSPAAVAGVFDTAGLWEIGVDVARVHRGRGLASTVVAAAARSILDAGETPYYACGVGNIRSQRSALATGFIPACAVAFVVEAGLGT